MPLSHRHLGAQGMNEVLQGDDINEKVEGLRLELWVN